MKVCSARLILKRRLTRFQSCLQGSGANAPFTTLGGLNDTWVQGRRATRFFINDNLAWSIGAHELRFGTNTRIFRLNDYDFGQGVVPVVTLCDPAAVHLWSCVHRLQNVPSSQFAALQFSSTWISMRRTLGRCRPALTWTFGIRDYPQLQSPQSAQRGGSPPRLV